MACDASTLTEYLTTFSGTDPIDAIICPFTQTAGGGLGIGLALFTLLTVGPLGLAMANRIQHPGPLIVAGMLTIGVFAGSLPGQASTIAAIVFFFAIVGFGYYIYRWAGNAL